MQVDVKSVEPFSDYVGEPFSYEHGLQYFISKFQGVNRNAEKGKSAASSPALCRADKSDRFQKYSCM
jgi:hypothetical protein